MEVDDAKEPEDAKNNSYTLQEIEPKQEESDFKGSLAALLAKGKPGKKVGGVGVKKIEVAPADIETKKMKMNIFEEEESPDPKTDPVEQPLIDPLAFAIGKPGFKPNKRGSIAMKKFIDDSDDD